MTLERFCVVMGMLLLVELGLLFQIQQRPVAPVREVRVVTPSAPAPTPKPAPTAPEPAQIAVARPAPPVPSRPKTKPEPVEPAAIPGASDCEHPDDPLCGLPELR